MLPRLLMLVLSVLLIRVVAEHNLDSEHPQIPWLALQVSSTPEVSEDCSSASSTFIMLLIQGRIGRISPEDVQNKLTGRLEDCSSAFGVSTDDNRWPRVLVTVRCKCEGRHCYLFGTYACSTLYGEVNVLQRRSAKGKMMPSKQILPVGCQCLERRSLRASHILPSAVHKRLKWN